MRTPIDLVDLLCEAYSAGLYEDTDAAVATLREGLRILGWTEPTHAVPMTVQGVASAE